MFTGNGDGTSQVRIPVATLVVVTPEFGDVAGVGGPITAVVIAAGVVLLRARRRRRTRRS